MCEIQEAHSERINKTENKTVLIHPNEKDPCHLHPLVINSLKTKLHSHEYFIENINEVLRKNNNNNEKRKRKSCKQTELMNQSHN